ncbi:MAG: lipoyl(octanoyl) transferase LipB [Thermoleophilia bacterium]
MVTEDSSHPDFVSLRAVAPSGPGRVSHTPTTPAMVYSRRAMTATSPQHPSESRGLLPVFDLGTVPYLPVQDLQAVLRTRVAERSLPGVLLLLEHPPVITLGSRGVEADVLSPALVESRRVPVVRSERGGAATLHAPGQLVSYPIIPVPRRDLRAYVNGLEQVLIDLLATLGVPAERHRGAPGVYTRDHKIASVGLRCRRWIASHGTSLNVSVDLSLFDAIVSCGEAGLRQTSVLQETGAAPSIRLVKDLYTRGFAEVFGVRLLETRSADILELLGGAASQ